LLNIQSDHVSHFLLTRLCFQTRACLLLWTTVVCRWTSSSQMHFHATQ